MFAGHVVVGVVLAEIVAFDNLAEDLEDLGQQHCLLVLEVFNKEVVGNDVSVGVVLVAGLERRVQLHRLCQLTRTNSGDSLRTLFPSFSFSLSEEAFSSGV
jgi:hypothetical protein